MILLMKAQGFIWLAIDYIRAHGYEINHWGVSNQWNGIYGLECGMEWNMDLNVEWNGLNDK